MSKSRVTWAIAMTILVFLVLSVLDLVPMYATDRQTDVRQKHRLMPHKGHGHKKYLSYFLCGHSPVTGACDPVVVRSLVAGGSECPKVIQVESRVRSLLSTIKTCRTLFKITSGQW